MLPSERVERDPLTGHVMVPGVSGAKRAFFWLTGCLFWGTPTSDDKNTRGHVILVGGETTDHIIRVIAERQCVDTNALDEAVNIKDLYMPDELLVPERPENLYLNAIDHDGLNTYHPAGKDRAGRVRFRENEPKERWPYFRDYTHITEVSPLMKEELSELDAITLEARQLLLHGKVRLSPTMCPKTQEALGLPPSEGPHNPLFKAFCFLVTELWRKHLERHQSVSTPATEQTWTWKDPQWGAI